eukprot:GILI01017185.1.p1 GENE.GILI01017185.1~~GILI01017185.1.p1  ORF type:complete len:185 (+),score=13.75 GILI01017185.1:728-1282(+)
MNEANDDKPFRSLWQALAVEGLKDTEIMKMVQHRCGLEGRSSRADGPFEHNQTEIDCDATPLMLAALANRFDVVKILISEGADVNAMASSYGDTALSLAVATDNLDLIVYLVDEGAEVYFGSPHCTPLHIAVQRACLPSVTALVNEGSNLLAIDFEGDDCIPLHLLSRYCPDYDEMARLLTPHY